MSKRTPAKVVRIAAVETKRETDVADLPVAAAPSPTPPAIPTPPRADSAAPSGDGADGPAAARIAALRLRMHAANDQMIAHVAARQYAVADALRDAAVFVTRVDQAVVAEAGRRSESDAQISAAAQRKLGAAAEEIDRSLAARFAELERRIAATDEKVVSALGGLVADRERQEQLLAGIREAGAAANIAVREELRSDRAASSEFAAMFTSAIEADMRRVEARIAAECDARARADEALRGETQRFGRLLDKTNRERACGALMADVEALASDLEQKQRLRADGAAALAATMDLLLQQVEEHDRRVQATRGLHRLISARGSPGRGL